MNEECKNNMKDNIEQFSAFKAWYDEQWIGDGEHGQVIPNIGDSRYAEYVDGYTLGLGAWIAGTLYERAKCLKVCTATPG